jgi:hypothetical protein
MRAIGLFPLNQETPMPTGSKVVAAMNFIAVALGMFIA